MLQPDPQPARTCLYGVKPWGTIPSAKSYRTVNQWKCFEKLLDPSRKPWEEGRVREFKRNRGIKLQRQAPEIYPWVTTPVHPLPPRVGSVDDLKPTSLRVLRERTRRGASDHANVQQAPRRPRSEYCQVGRSRPLLFFLVASRLGWTGN